MNNVRFVTAFTAALRILQQQLGVANHFLHSNNEHTHYYSLIIEAFLIQNHRVK